MKKIILLSLLSVFFLSAFCQTTHGSTEIITKINITKSAVEDFGDSEIDQGFWILFWRTVTSFVDDDGGVWIYCCGWGWKICQPAKEHYSHNNRGLDAKMLETTCEDMIAESDERVINGEYNGSITKKIAYSDPSSNSRISYILFQMDWDYERGNPRNGRAEIIISRTSDFGLR